MLVAIASQMTPPRMLAGEAGQKPDSETDASLEDVARDEREYVRGRLRDELKREPTDQEIDDWLRAQTEGY